ncbi:hypothetical protein SRIMM317S_04764 [Streptomyces rimosus subsp. rimosus]
MTVPSLPHPTGREAMPLPPEDRELSPYTGWTRAHWETTADHLLQAVVPHASPRNGLINLPGVRPSWSGPRSDGLEGYARTFLAAAFRVAGSRGEDPHGLLTRYAEGLAAGTEHPVDEPGLDAHPDAWPLIPGTRQAIVESASVALGLRLTRPWLWDTLDEEVRTRAVDWLLPALDPPPIDNNWWLFGLTVGEVFLWTRASRRSARRRPSRRAGAHRRVVPRRGVVQRRPQPVLRPLQRLGAALLSRSARPPFRRPRPARHVRRAAERPSRRLPPHVRRQRRPDAVRPLAHLPLRHPRRPLARRAHRPHPAQPRRHPPADLGAPCGTSSTGARRRPRGCCRSATARTRPC